MGWVYDVSKTFGKNQLMMDFEGPGIHTIGRPEVYAQIPDVTAASLRKNQKVKVEGMLILASTMVGLGKMTLVVDADTVTSLE